MGGRPKKLPSREEVVRLYVEEGLATTQIARMFGVTDPHTVRTQLVKAGVVLRRHTVRRTCVECNKPVKRTLHKGNGSFYGKRCEEHQKQHRQKVCSDYGNRFRRQHPEIVKQRYEEWVERLRQMTPHELLNEIKEKPCQFKKEELLRKMRKLNRMGRSGEAIEMVTKWFPLLPQKQA